MSDIQKAAAMLIAWEITKFTSDVLPPLDKHSPDILLDTFEEYYTLLKIRVEEDDELTDKNNLYE